MSSHVTADLELVDPGQGLDLIEAFVLSHRARLADDIVTFSLRVESETEWRCFVEEELPPNADVLERARALHRDHLVNAEDRALWLRVELRPNPTWSSRPSSAVGLRGRRSPREASAWHSWRDACLALGRTGIYTTKRPTRTIAGVALDRSFLVGLFTELCDRVQPKTLQVQPDEGQTVAPWGCHLVYHRTAAGFLDDLTPRLGTRARSIGDGAIETAILGAEGVEPLACKNGLGVIAVPFLAGRVGGVYDRLTEGLGTGDAGER